jgi:ankyrin repeat protein
VVNLLVEAGAEIGQTPLWQVAKAGHETVVKLLVEAGAEVASTDGRRCRGPRLA